MQSRDVIITGLVQGIGFRPFVYRLANTHGLAGWVENRSDCVAIHVEGPSDAIEAFVQGLHSEAPPLARIESLEMHSSSPKDSKAFTIRPSAQGTDTVAWVSPDIAVCDKCLADMKRQPHRIDYPFVNCTLCGPRYTIVRDMPYDRSRTTMASFPMCETCRSEYENIEDRRFHAQPVACNNCGPHYELHHDGSRYTEALEVVGRTAELLAGGAIVAIKGLGGFHLACNALDNAAVERLRGRKRRDGKPFALMFGNIDSIRRYAHVGPVEEETLLSPTRPIVLLQQKQELCEALNRGLQSLGIMLPYLPFHHQLFEALSIPAIVLTSGNFSEEPIVIDNRTALTRLCAIADATVVHNRDIHNRVDDSVVRVVGNGTRLLRRSRGYAPSPIALDTDVDGILAAGAELKNCFALGKDQYALLSQHIGDLKTAETYDFYLETMERMKRLFRFEPALIACDMHPDYLSTRHATQTGLPTTAVQHHHAHIASCMAEHGLTGKVIGIALDGTGYGDDGTTWGGEFLICDLIGYERFAHFTPVMMPGGDRAVAEPWRLAVSFLRQARGVKATDLDLPVAHDIPLDKRELVDTALERGINCPLSSGAGRVFDAAAAVVGLCSHAGFEAEGPMRLESIVDPAVDESYEIAARPEIDTPGLIAAIADDVRRKVAPSTIAAKFHNAIVRSVIKEAKAMRRNRGITNVVLSGGSFQNGVILGRTEAALKENGFSVFTHRQVPCNDGGVAVGQLRIAAQRREESCV